MKSRFAGVQRNTEFSPNHVGTDQAIIKRTGQILETMGHQVDWFIEGEDVPDCREYELVFSMAQGPIGNRNLMVKAKEGGLIINSPESVMNCYRVNMATLLPGRGIPFPVSYVVPTNPALDGKAHTLFQKKHWVKRGDVHAVHKEDVTLVYSPDEERSVLLEYYRRGIPHAILQEHLEGDTVKFYAVREMGFFHWYYLSGALHTPFNTNRLAALAEKAAEVLGLFVYGGDAVIGADGSITIIDINDWPSFAPVCDAASLTIAQLLARKAEEYVHERKS